MGQSATTGLRVSDDTLARIDALPRSALKALWEETFDQPPPASMSSRLLRFALIFEVQAGTFGGESKASRRVWTQIAEKRSRGASPEEAVLGVSLARTKGLPEGSRFVRTWKGRTHEVVVLTRDNGGGRFVWNERSYRSLSAIAREITGTIRNGPAFFGLRETGP